MRTYPGIEEGAVFARNPWRAPGTAKVMSPCGWHGGNPIGCPIGMSECTCAPASVMPNFRRVCLSDGIRHVYTHVCYFFRGYVSLRYFTRDHKQRNTPSAYACIPQKQETQTRRQSAPEGGFHSATTRFKPCFPM